MAKDIAKVGRLRALNHPLGKLWRNEDDAAIPAQHHIARHHRRMANTRGSIDADHGRVEQLTGAQRSVMVRWIVIADESHEIRQFLQAIDIPYGAVVNNAVA